MIRRLFQRLTREGPVAACYEAGVSGCGNPMGVTVPVDPLRRRAFVGTLGLGILAGPLAVHAQQAGRTFRVGFLSTINPRTATFFEGLIQHLRHLGYVEGHNLAIEFKNAEGDVARLPGLAAELVRLNVDVIVAAGAEVTPQAARNATSTIPTVIIAFDYDPLARAYVVLRVG